MLILEGWCLGARPQAECELTDPVNALEREQDADGIARRWVNARLDDYRALFDRIDRLVFLAAPGFEIVEQWRMQQEHALRRSQGVDAGMTDVEVAVFVQHYQRLTEHMLRHADGWADLTIKLDAERRTASISGGK
jgi:D-glycerate 3-kinase